MKLNIIITTVLVLMSTFSGCAMPGGEKCLYNEFPAIATIKEQKDKSTILKIYSKYYYYAPGFYKKDIEVNHINFDIGTKIPAKVRRIKKGACTPIVHDIILKEYKAITDTSISIPREGLLPEKTRSQISLLAKHFIDIKRDFPQTKLYLYGRTNERKSEEYRYALCIKLANRIKSVLIKEGIDDKSMVIFSNPKVSHKELLSEKNLDRVTFKIKLKY